MQLGLQILTNEDNRIDDTDANPTIKMTFLIVSPCK
jgi:hypothetical protein